MKTKDILISVMLLLATAISLRAWPMESARESDAETRLPQSSSTTGEHADGARGMDVQADRSTSAARSAAPLAVSENEPIAIDESAPIAVIAVEIHSAMPYARNDQNEGPLPGAAVNLSHIAPFHAESAIAAPEHISLETLLDMGADEGNIRASLLAAGVSETELQNNIPIIQRIFREIHIGLLNRRDEEGLRAAITQAETDRIIEIRNVPGGKEELDRDAEERAIVYEAVRVARAEEREQARRDALNENNASSSRQIEREVSHHGLGNLSFLPASLQRALARTQENLSDESEITRDAGGFSILPVVTPAARDSMARAQAPFINQAISNAHRVQLQGRETTIAAEAAAKEAASAAFKARQKAATDAARVPYHNYFATHPEASHNNPTDRAAARVYGKAAYDEVMAVKK